MNKKEFKRQYGIVRGYASCIKHPLSLSGHKGRGGVAYDIWGLLSQGYRKAEEIYPAAYRCVIDRGVASHYRKLTGKTQFFHSCVSLNMELRPSYPRTDVRCDGTKSMHDKGV